MSASKVQQYAGFYTHSLGYRVVPLEPEERRCLRDKWEERTFGPDEFLPDENIGLRSLDGLVVIDPDCPEAVALADEFLPHTNAVWGRPSAPRVKRLYRCPGVKTETWTDVGGEHLLQLRVGLQDMAPPSIWVSKSDPNQKEQQRWFGRVWRGFEAVVEPDVLLSGLRDLYAAALIGRHWPPRGGRHNTRLSYARVLMGTLGLTEDRAVKILQAACRVGGSDSKGVEDVREAVKDTRAKLVGNEPATGAPTIEALLPHGAVIVKLLRKLYGRTNTLTARRASEVPDRKPERLFGGRLTRGNFQLLVGPGDVGKGMVLVDVVARLTTGRAFPGEERGREPTNVVLLVVEDSEAAVKARLRAAGADLDRAYFVAGPSVVRGGLIMPSPVMFDNDAGALVEFAKERAIGALVLETTLEHLGDREGKKRFSTNNEAEVRRELAPFRAVCQTADIYGWGVMHPRKTTEGGIADSISGSAAFRNVGRGAHHIYVDPRDKTPDPVRLFCTSKANYLARRPPTLRFRIVSWKQDPDEGHVEWFKGHELVDPRDAERVWSEIQERGKARRDFANMDAEQLLRQLLEGGGKKRIDEIEAEGKAQKISWSAMRRAKEKLGIESVKSDFDGGWSWRWPKERL